LPNDEIYLPHAQSDAQFSFMTVVMRAHGDPLALRKPVEEQVRALDKDVPIAHVQSMQQVIADKLWRGRLAMTLLGLFSAVAVSLAALGIYGAISYSVSQRTGEIGIRMALGADRSQVGWQVMREIAVLVLAGIAVGLPVTLAGQRLVGDMLYGLKGTDPLSIAGAVFLLSSAALVAGYIPARRASRINPLSALRYE